jgi:hypothetical protein
MILVQTRIRAAGVTARRVRVMVALNARRPGPAGAAAVAAAEVRSARRRARDVAVKVLGHG